MLSHFFFSAFGHQCRMELGDDNFKEVLLFNSEIIIPILIWKYLNELSRHKQLAGGIL